MAAPMEARLAVPRICKLLANSRKQSYQYMLHVRQMGLVDKLKFMQWRKKETEMEQEIVATEREIQTEARQFRKREFIEEKRSYQPPLDAAATIQAITSRIYGPSEDWLQIPLSNRIHKFNLLTYVMDELDHDIPNMDLNEMNIVEDVVKFFNVEVKDTSLLEDLTKLDLPKNLHMNLEYIRFHPDTDKIHDGITAFPGRATKVTSIKYKRKYKGYDGGDPINYPEQFVGQS